MANLPTEDRAFGNIQRPDVFSQISAEIKEHIQKNNLIQNIKGKNYPLVEAWQFSGALLGLFPRLRELENLSKDHIYKYRAIVDIIDYKNDKIVSTGVAICSKEEGGKNYFEEYAIASMAQTRATGKAFRLCLGWLLKASGYDATPAEEMQQHEPKEKDVPGIKALSREYKAFAIQALKSCDRANDIHSLVKLAKTFELDKDFIDTARDLYKELANAGQ